MNIFASRIAAVALTAVATLAPVATPALAEDFAVAGAPGLVHVVDAAGEARCDATVIAPKAVLASAACVTNNGRVVQAKDIKIVEGDTTTPVSIVWAHADALQNDLAVITLNTALESDPVALDTFSLNAKHPALGTNVAWVNSIVTALNAQEAETTPALPAATATPVTPQTPVVTAPAARNPIRHFVRVER